MWSNTLLALTLVSQLTTDYYTWIIVFCTISCLFMFTQNVPTQSQKRQKETLPTSLSHESGWLRDRDHTADSTSAYSSDVHGVPTKQLLFVELKWSQNEHVFV